MFTGHMCVYICVCLFMYMTILIPINQNPQCEPTMNAKAEPSRLIS